MHIATSGQTGFQRMLYIARKKNSRRKEVRELEENQWGRGPPVSQTVLQLSQVEETNIQKTQLG